MELECGLGKLRPWQLSDVDSLQHHANNRDIWLNLRDRFPYPYTRDAAETWLRHATTAASATDFAIEVDGAAVGGIGFQSHEDIERISVEIGYWLGAEYWGRGLMSAAVSAATGYAFTVLSVTRVFAVPFARNAASIRVLEKAGYRREGVMRRSAIKDGVVLDQVLYAITDHDLAIHQRA
jgi:ribosomal-protein-alanine N-acetyltransferase